VGAADELRRTGLDALDLVKDIDKLFVNQCRGAFYTAVLMADRWLGDEAALFADADRFLEDVCNTPAAKCSICREVLLSQTAENLSATDSYRAEYIRSYEQYAAQERTEQEQIIEESIIFVKDNVSEKIYRDAKLRHAYYEMHAVNTRVTGDYAGLDYTQMCSLLEEFATCNLRFADQVYTEEAFSGEMEMMEESCRAAVWIRRMLDCGKDDWNGRLENLRNAAKAWPGFGETVKQAAALLGEEQERQGREADEADKELRRMAAEVKKQVAVLMDAGMDAEALGIVKQLRQMLPKDKEIAKLEKELEK
jgi:hypothetical protein